MISSNTSVQEALEFFEQYQIFTAEFVIDFSYYTHMSQRLISPEHEEQISSWIDYHETPYNVKNNPYKYKRIFKASIDGSEIEDFHKKCNNKRKTVVVLKVHQTNEIIGGYNPLNWEKTNSKKYAETKDSFIFRFSNIKSTISRVKNVNKAIHYDKCFGPSFGKRDLSLRSTNMIIDNMWYCKKKSYHEQICSV
ncbi:hypothetical protein C2G38_2073571, partial [Gigaspora rosea]